MDSRSDEISFALIACSFVAMGCAAWIGTLLGRREDQRILFIPSPKKITSARSTRKPPDAARALVRGPDSVTSGAPRVQDDPGR